MKTRNLLLGMACMAVFSACSNNEEPVMPAAQTRAVTINASTGADTRTSLAVDDEGLKRTWAATDKLSILFKGTDNSTMIEVFDLKSGEGTTSGTFEKSDSQLPATGNVKVLAWVNPNNDKYADFDISVQNGSLDDYNYGLVNNDWLTTETTATDGAFPALSLESKSIFLKIPAGTKLVNNVTGNHNVVIGAHNNNIVKRYDFNITDEGDFDYKIAANGNVNAGNAKGKIWVALKDGALVDDCYLSIMTSGEITSLSLKVTAENTAFADKEIAVRTFSKPLEFGHIYTIQQSDLTLAE